jgi:hypothetical protein
MKRDRTATGSRVSLRSTPGYAPTRTTTVARVEQSETRVGAAMATTSPGFASLNAGLPTSEQEY